jgi:hypothetical protein
MMPAIGLEPCIYIPDVLDKFRSMGVKNFFKIPCDTFATETHNRLRYIPVKREDYEQAGEVSVAVLGLMEGPPSDDNPPISHFDRWTEPGLP